VYRNSNHFPVISAGNSKGNLCEVLQIFQVSLPVLVLFETLVLLGLGNGFFAKTDSVFELLFGLLFFGAEGFRNPSFWDMRVNLGGLAIKGQAIIIFMVSLALIVLLWQFFARTLYGKALQATAVNRLGARLMGISTIGAGQATFAMAALIGALSGLLIGPTTTVFYDSGFLIGLKGFVAAVMGGLQSYPLAAVGAIFVGLVEAFGSFWASAFKEVIVFTLVLPILLWRSMADGHAEEH